MHLQVFFFLLFCFINIHLCIAFLSGTAHLHSISARSSSVCTSANLHQRGWGEENEWLPVCEILNCRAITVDVGACAFAPSRACLVSTPHSNSVPPPPCVIAVMSADCGLLWCLCLSSIWPMLGIWPGLIVLMVTPASCPQVGRPNCSPEA